MTLSDVALAIKVCLDLKEPASSFHAPYYNTLPLMDYFSTALPLCWPEAKLRSLLRGSPFTLAKALRQQSEIRRLYNDIVSKVAPSVTFGEFLYAFCNISTRSFHVVSEDGKFSVEGLIPFMDMSNHKRPRDLTFALELYDEEASATATASRSRVIVKTLRDVQCGEQVCITYGAKGNEALLLSYGFCILNNAELDGSSNDVFFRSLSSDDADSEAQQYMFRLGGGASYSFGCLSKALEKCRDESRKGNSKGSKQKKEKALDLEVTACMRLEEYLSKEIDKMASARATNASSVVSHYEDFIAKADEGDEWQEAEKHCCILGLSEVLTLQFYLNATRCLLTVLDSAVDGKLNEACVEAVVKKWHSSSEPTTAKEEETQCEDTSEDTINVMKREAKNIDKLILVYCRIRLKMK